MPTSIELCVSINLNGKIHVFGGGSFYQIYDPELDIWINGESKITTSYFPLATITANIDTPKRVYVFGVTSDSWYLPNLPSATGQSYDPNTGNWNLVDSVSNLHIAGGAVTIDDRIYLVGGGVAGWAGGISVSDKNHMFTPFLLGSTPQISIVSPVNKIYNQTISIPLEIIVNEPTSWIGYSIGSRDNVTYTENINLTIVDEGLQTLIVYARDMAGDESSSKITFTVDVYPPVVFVLSPENKTYSDANITLNVEFEEPILQMMYSLDGLENVTFTENITFSDLEIGRHNVRVYATDLAGHTGVSETIYFSIEPFPTILIIVLVAIIVIVGVLLLILKKRK